MTKGVVSGRGQPPNMFLRCQIAEGLLRVPVMAADVQLRSVEAVRTFMQTAAVMLGKYLGWYAGHPGQSSFYTLLTF